MPKEIPKALQTRMNDLATRIRRQNQDQKGKSVVNLGGNLEQLGIDPRDVYDIPSMEGRLPPELLQQYNAAVQSVLAATFETGVRDTKSVHNSMEKLLEYQQQAIEQLGRSFETIADPNASEADKQAAKAWADTLSQTNLGDIHDKNSPLRGFMDGGPGFFNSDVPFGTMTPDQEASLLANVEQLNPEDYTIGEQVDQRGRAYREALQGIDYQDMPVRELAQVAAIDPRVVSELELVDPALADQIVSQWQDPEFLNNLDLTGQNAIGQSLDYYDQLIANGGRDAVSDAFMNRATQEAEMRRRANLEAFQAQQDARGMSGSGGELQAALQGAGQSMNAQFNAAMEAAAMQQQRRDAAAEQRAIQGAALQALTDGRAATMAEAVDLATRERAGMQQQIASENAAKQTSAADQNFGWAGQQAMENAQLQDTANRDQFQAQTAENQARNREREAAERIIATTGIAGTTQDAATRRAIDEGNRAATEAGQAAAVGQGNTAFGLGLQERQLQHEIDSSKPNAWDMAASAAGFIPAGTQLVDTFSNLAKKKEEDK